MLQIQLLTCTTFITCCVQQLWKSEEMFGSEELINRQVSSSEDDLFK